jgi:hypothetical protein
MIKSLRKKHLQIWSLWAVLLPIGIISATMVRTSIPADQGLQIKNAGVLPVLIAEKNWQGDVVQLRGYSRAAAGQLVWLNNQPLHVASATIYQVSSDSASIQQAQYVGRIESRGNYVFTLHPLKWGNNECHLIIYDFIHQQIIERINFKL